MAALASRDACLLQRAGDGVERGLALVRHSLPLPHGACNMHKATRHNSAAIADLGLKLATGVNAFNHFSFLIKKRRGVIRADVIDFSVA